MNFIEALQKYSKITNDGGKTVYSTSSEGFIIKEIGELAGATCPTLELLTSTGWKEYNFNLNLPERVDYDYYYYLDIKGNINSYCDTNHSFDISHYETYNYFPTQELARYVSDKILICKVSSVLNALNTKTPDKDRLIQEYIETNYSEVVKRIREYEEKEGITNV